ncbi:Signal transducer regulating beta-lactamase production, contains metallopeptidase domain [Aquimarina amphilecti]|uniref:Signal transducer regulating beta-lactamase production, contains metallopeptidase domain n=1 Tax=Aquimarina amphilecti TaxID=1038014 RepID=A0A1H7RNT0_AQUAM|nr:M56 family metallopeptidase [Aquimarina amphilecti]SEL61047.1 Signal transducer regulating beta-lactamase production, contains metallopeptidase domain [Aquimarina amphilecti]
MFYYLLQILIFQLVFLLIYDLLHKKDTFFNWNRLYLLIVPFLSLALPFIEIDFLNSSATEAYVSTIEKTIIASTERTILNPNSINDNSNTFSESINWWLIIYLMGITINIILLILKFHKLHILRNVSNISRAFDKRIVILPNSSHAFSFWNTIFLGDALTEEEKKNIISHELVHVNHKHTIDQIGIEILKVLLWWNPLIYIYQARITLLHEYIADSVTINKVNQRNYIEQLLNSAFQTEKITFINQFFNQSLIKKRILMLQKSQSKSIAKFKYLLLIPVITGILTYTSCKDDGASKSEDATITQEENNDTSQKIATSNQPSCLNKDSKYDNTLDNYLKITNGKNADIIAKIISLTTNEVIRTAIIYKSQTHFIRNIPQGSYRVDAIYGSQYAEQEKHGVCSGSFKTELLSETGEDVLDYNVIISEKGKNVPSYSLALDLLPEDLKKENDYALETINKTGKEKKEQSDQEMLKNAQKLAEKYNNNSSTRTNDISKKEAEPYCANSDESRYDYRLDNYLKVTNGKNAEVIIDIVNLETLKSVRTIHLPKNTEYFVRNIPESKYHLRIVYGEGYKKEEKNEKCVLSFTNKKIEERGQDILDFNTVISPQGINVPSYSISLDMLDEHKHQ